MTGKDFSEDVNYLLFVDDGGRALQLPAVETSVAPDLQQSATSASQPTGTVEDRFVPRFGFGRSVQPVSVKSWQVAQHPGPLTVAQAMLFSETAKVDMLNDPQWDAIGRWVCLGGTVFVHESSKEVLERLKKAAPLGTLPAVLQDEHQVSRCGTGSIREYNGRLFSADESRAIKTVLEASSRLSRYSVVSIPGQLPLIYVGTSNASFTRLMVLAVFSIYLLFSGVVALLMFRSNRRRVVTYTVSVVTIACVAAALLGSYLRNSRGDLLWRSVIVGGPGGAVQIGQIRVQSAGGRNTQVAVRGKKTDLQLLRKKSTDRSDNYSRFAVYNLGQTEGAVGYEHRLRSCRRVDSDQVQVSWSNTVNDGTRSAIRRFTGRRRLDVRAVVQSANRVLRSAAERDWTQGDLCLAWTCDSHNVCDHPVCGSRIDSSDAGSG
jgi:hypothetical protein